jgi:NAD(P)H-hydrate epimerase
MTVTRSMTREQARDIDRRAADEFGMSTLVLMENAGRGLADLLCQQEISGPVAVCCGGGNNGGDGFVLARHLDLRRVPVRVLLWGDPAKAGGDAAANLAILEKAGLAIERFTGPHDPARLQAELDGADWIIDALLGTGARGEPRSPLAEVIDQLNAQAVRILAVDLPSGLDCDSGQPAKRCIRAQHTGTFVAAKRGFSAPGASDFTGQVHVLDIGAPRVLVDRMLDDPADSSEVG